MAVAFHNDKEQPESKFKFGHIMNVDMKDYFIESSQTSIENIRKNNFLTFFEAGWFGTSQMI